MSISIEELVQAVYDETESVEFRELSIQDQRRYLLNSIREIKESINVENNKDMTNEIIKAYLESGKLREVIVKRFETSGNLYRVTLTGMEGFKSVSQIRYLDKKRVNDFASKFKASVADYMEKKGYIVESKPAELPLFNEDTDRERLTKYFKSIRQLPALESNKAKSRASEYLNDLSIFIDKWEGIFGV